MALSAATGTLNVTTAAAGNTVAVSGLGFQPSCLIFFWTGRTATGSGRASSQRGIGVAVSTTERWAIATRSADASANADADTAHTESNCIISQDSAGAISGTMDLQSFDAGGFTLVIDVAFAVNYLVHYLALGGTSLTGAKATRFTAAGTAPVTQAVTVETGFTPTCVLFASPNSAGTPPTNTIDARLTIGAMSGATEEGVWCGGSNDTSANMQTVSYCFGAECIAGLSTTVTAPSDRAEFSSFDANGFTINWLERAVAGRIYYLALKGVDAIVGNLLTQTNTTTAIAESGFGFAPAAVMFVSHGKAQSTQDTQQDHDCLSVGFATSASSRNVGTTHDEDAVTTSEVTIAASTAAVYQNIDTTDAVVGLMDIQSFDSDGFTCIMDDADPSQAFVWYVALGPGGAQQFTLTADSAAFTVTGTDANLRATRLITAAAGSFTVTGTDATLRLTRKLSADVGSYAVTGTDAGVRATRLLTADAGSFAVTGTDAALRVARKVVADAGAYVVTGTDVTLTYTSGYTITAESGSFTITGTSANLRATRQLIADAGAYSVTGTATGLTASRRVTADSGSFSVNGTAATLELERVLTADAGSYSVAGTDATLQATRHLAALSGAFVITGADAVLFLGELPSVDVLGVTGETLQRATAVSDTWQRAGATGDAWINAGATGENLRRL